VITRAIHQALRQSLTHAIHDLSEGGLAVAAAEMSIAGRLGLELNLADLPRSADVETDACALFAESSSRFLVEVSPESASAFEQIMGDSAYTCIGCVTADRTLRIFGLKGDVAIECSIETLRQAWQSATIV
jgi:phosphoribosylformylglycinamidine synthase